MSPNPDGILQASDHGLTVTARTVLDGDRRAHVCLAGEIDMAASAVLSETVDWLTAFAPNHVLIDLAGLTFACSTLPNFVVRVRHAVPAGTELVLCRARPVAGWMLRLTGMATIATLRDEPTEPPAIGV